MCWDPLFGAPGLGRVAVQLPVPVVQNGQPNSSSKAKTTLIHSGLEEPQEGRTLEIIKRDIMSMI